MDMYVIGRKLVRSYAATPAASARRRAVQITVVWLTLSCAAQVQAFEACGDLANAYGPFDYRTAAPAQLRLVEGDHFTPVVESLQSGSSSAYPGHDIDFLLRAFPNHPRGLLAMSKLGEKEKTPKPRGAHYAVGCYFDRAVRFRPDDSMVRVLYGTHLLRQGKKEQAIQELQKAQELGGDSANLHYNLGLAFFEIGDYSQALVEAKKAYGLGFPLPGLRDKLKRVGKWED